MSRWFTVVCGAVLVLAACGSDDGLPLGAEATEPSSVTTGAPPTPTETSTSSSLSTESSTSSTSTTTPEEDEVQACADVIDGTASVDADGTYTVSATVRSGDTGWEKYADAWVVQSEDGTVFGERILAHPHETEQPFTRSLGGVEIPEGTTTVVLAARDLVNGYCGATFTIGIGG